jgi:hypothetical protein
MKEPTDTGMRRTGKTVIRRKNALTKHEDGGVYEDTVKGTHTWKTTTMTLRTSQQLNISNRSRYRHDPKIRKYTQISNTYIPACPADFHSPKAK